MQDFQAAVVVSLLRSGTDSRAARLFKEMCAGGKMPLVRQLSVALEPRPDRRVAAEQAAFEHAGRSLALAAACGAVPLIAARSGYPARLAEIVDPPIVLWAAGRADMLERPAVAVVGSRNASASGIAQARRLGRDLAQAGLTVVSGLARGIDAAAHEGALEGGGPTVAVLGCGVDVVYPRQHGQLSRRIREAGCLVSELPPAAPPLPRHFPLRNRVISGLSLAVVVVEAAERSGSLITARTALEQGRDVLAVPGAVVSGCHRGCHALIKDGAGLVETAEDVLDALGWRGSRARDEESPGPGAAGQMRRGEPVSLDVLAARLGRPAADVLADLGVLEVEGVVERMAGGLFVKLD